MIVLEAVSLVSLVSAVLPMTMTLFNLELFKAPKLVDDLSPPRADYESPQVSVCVPARNEASNIEACVQSILDSANVSVQVLVYDDQSSDATPSIIASIMKRDSRCQRVATKTMELGWNGKQWGCQQMGLAATTDWLLFTDADVRFGAHAVMLGLNFAQQAKADLVSTFPRQLCGSLGEALVVPLIHFMLLGYLPMALMRVDSRRSLGAGCGQYLLVKRNAWLKAGGHAAFANSMHDGIQLPRAVRDTGGRTDLFDATDHISVRMYHGFASTWKGFTKNAYEGLGSMPTLLLFTTLHVLGHIAPIIVLLAWIFGFTVTPFALACFSGAFVAGFVTRILLATRFHQPWIGVLLHPLTMALMTAIQWRSLFLQRSGRRAWRGRFSGV